MLTLSPSSVVSTAPSYFIGIDFHKRYSVYAVVDPAGERVAHGRIEGNARSQQRARPFIGVAYFLIFLFVSAPVFAGVESFESERLQKNSARAALVRSLKGNVPMVEVSRLSPTILDERPGRRLGGYRVLSKRTYLSRNKIDEILESVAKAILSSNGYSGLSLKPQVGVRFRDKGQYGHIIFGLETGRGVMYLRGQSLVFTCGGNLSDWEKYF